MSMKPEPCVRPPMPLYQVYDHSERILPWVRLGEAILATFQHRNPGRLPTFLPLSKIGASQVKETVHARLLVLKKSLQVPIFGTSIATCLRWDPAEPEGQDDTILLIVAALCWLRLSGWIPESRINILCSVASCCLDCPPPEALVRTRYTVHFLAEEGVLSVRDDKVFLSRSIALIVTDAFPEVMQTLMEDEAPTCGRNGHVRGGMPSREEADNRFRDFLKNLPVLRPAELERGIIASGYVSQEHARKAVCIAASRHARRLWALHVGGKKPEDLPKRDCLLMIGPSGCGKTHLLETVFGGLLKLPVVIFDAGQITESAYVGAKPDTVIERLLQIASGNIRIAECGVICLDELDKIAAVGTAGGTTPGESINRDVAGSGAQKGLLKLLEGASLSVSANIRGSEPWTFDSRNTLVVGAGAFSALRQHRHQGNPIGFGGEFGGGFRGELLQSTEIAAIGADDLIRYGFLSEFLGRFSHLVHFHTLTVPDLREILTRNVIPRHQAELAMEGIRLSVDDAVIDHLVDEAAAKKSGARGLQTCLSAVMQDCLFDALSADNVQGVHLSLGNGGVAYEIQRRPPARPTARPPGRSADRTARGSV